MISPNSASAAALCSRSPDALLSFTANNVDSVLECSKQRSFMHHSLPNLQNFVRDVCQRNHVAPCVLVVALIYLDRLKRNLSNMPGRAKGKFDTPYKIFLAAILVASKYTEDNNLRNSTICAVSGNLFTVKEINEMERSFLGLIKYELWVNMEEVRQFVEKYGSELELELESDDGSDTDSEADLERELTFERLSLQDKPLH